jgi:hypothetical protein
MAGGMAAPFLGDVQSVLASETNSSKTTDRKVKYRVLGKTGLRISEIGIGGHSWAYKQVPDGQGGYRRPTIDEAVRMIAAGMDLGVNLHPCFPQNEGHQSRQTGDIQVD